MPRTIVVGAGQGAGQLVASLRQEKYEGEIVMIGEEPFLPYQRPPLSKAYLAGELPTERVLVRPEKFYVDKGIETRIDTRVEAIDREARTVNLAGGETMSWDHLVIATGSHVRRLPIPGIELDGVHYLRTMGDVDGIRSGIGEGKRLVIVGGGYIGLEVAAVARKLGMEVTVLEMEDRILARVTTPSMSAFYTRVHTEHGVDIRTGTAAADPGRRHRYRRALHGRHGAEGRHGNRGRRHHPDDRSREAAGLTCENGIVVDAHCRTSDPAIFAIGDCTNHPSKLLGRRLRLESVPNAMDQARTVAKNIMGGDAGTTPCPGSGATNTTSSCKWSGSPPARTTRSSAAIQTGSFARFYLTDGVLTAVDANCPKEFMASKLLVAAQKPIDAGQLADEAVDIKSLI